MTLSVLRRPSHDLLPAYAEALARDWSPDNTRPEAAQEQLSRIKTDAEAFLASMEDRAAKGPPVPLPDGTQVPRLPSCRRWIWKDGFAGSIGMRWMTGTEDLPPTCFGHIGYAVVPWRRREGLAKRALQELLPETQALGLRHVDLTADPDNIASRKVILAAGGAFIGAQEKPAAYGGGFHNLYRIHLGRGGRADT